MKQKVLVFSIAMNGYQWLYRSLGNSHRAYAKKHNYQYVQVTQPASSLLGMEIAWLKITLAIKSLQAGYDWVIFLDADTQVSDATPAIETLECTDKYLYGAKGFSGRLNSGVLILKNHRCIINYLNKVLFNAEQPVDSDSDVGWGENGHLIQYAKNAFYVEYLHHRWNNNQDPLLNDYIRHYSRGPMHPLFKPSWFDKVLFRIHFHGVCKLKKWLDKRAQPSLEEKSTFKETLYALTERVIVLYPELVNPTGSVSLNKDKEVATSG